MPSIDPTTALSWPLRAFADWHFTAHCPACRFMARRDVDRLRTQRGDWCLVGNLVARLRYGKCGDVPAAVDLADGAEGAGRAVTRVQLLGML